MSLVDWDLTVDWNGDGDNADQVEAAEFTESVLNESETLSVQYGRDQDRALSPPMAGECSFTLNNDSKVYSRENTASPLYGNVRPGKPVTVAGTLGATSYTLFAGYTDTLDESVRDRQISVTCRDMLSRLQTEVSTSAHFSITTGKAFGFLLDAVGWPDDLRDIDRGATMIRWWWCEGDAYQMMQDLLASEGPPALVTVDSDGRFVFRDRHHRVTRPRSITSQTTFRDGGDIEPILSGFEYSAGWQDVINSVEIDVDVRERQYASEPLPPVGPDGETTHAISEVWKSDAPAYVLEDGEIIHITATASDPFVGAVAPERDTDYELTSGAVSTSISRTSGQSTVIRLQAVGPTALKGLRLRAYPLAVVHTSKVTESDAVSKRSFGVKAGGSAPWADVNSARAVAQVLLAYRADALPTVKITMDGIGDVTAMGVQLGTDLSDRVTVVESQSTMNADVYVESIKHDITEVGNRVVTTFGCEKVPLTPKDVFLLDDPAHGLDTGVLGARGLMHPETVFILDSPTQGRLDDPNSLLGY